MYRARAIRRAVRILLAPAVLAACDPTDVLTHDVTVPSVAISGIANGETIIENRAISVSVSDADSDLIEFSIFLDGSKIFTSVPDAKSATKGLTLVGGRDNVGNHLIMVRAVDQAENSRDLSVAYTVFAP